MAEFDVGNFGSAFAGGLRNGNALAQMRLNQEEAARAAQAREFLSQNAGAIMSGDANALAGYAQFDPQGAFTMQRQMGADTRAAEIHSMDMQYTRQQLDNARQQGRINMEAHTAKMDALQASKVAEQLTLGLQGAAMEYRKGPEAYARYVQSNAQELQALGLTPEQLSYENFLPTAATVKGGIEALEAAGSTAEAMTPKPADEYGRYAAEETAAGRTPMSRIDYKRAGQKTTRTVVGPDGSVTIAEGFGDGAPSLNVDQGKNTGFYIRMKESNDTLNQLEEQGLNFGQQALEGAPMGTGNYLRTPEFQMFDQARRDFVNAILRRESGAVISPEEFENANKQYFPVPGDSPEVIAQKRRNRQTALEGIRIGAAGGADYVDQQSGAQDAGQQVQEQIQSIPDFGGMTDEELDAWISQNGQ
ncbi:hypothetical protein [Salipiger thiooxidans]|uniref:hypothetical protein n=1 Tax=Salipiger thiooxidans TaxID=282683 RepID=UPI001CD77761|nr:hypothetical protein [Salipiger thiooxidans]MCA0846122.1 hypothetical protein [Salipiger thiooxidans]